jgi:hypothetical protein
MAKRQRATNNNGDDKRAVNNVEPVNADDVEALRGLVDAVTKERDELATALQECTAQLGAASRRPGNDKRIPDHDQAADLCELVEVVRKAHADAESLAIIAPALPVDFGEPHGYVSDHVEMRLTRRQAVALRAVFDGCIAAGVRTPQRRVVDSHAAAVRWILDAIADAAGNRLAGGDVIR